MRYIWGIVVHLSFFKLSPIPCYLYWICSVYGIFIIFMFAIPFSWSIYIRHLPYFFIPHKITKTTIYNYRGYKNIENMKKKRSIYLSSKYKFCFDIIIQLHYHQVFLIGYLYHKIAVLYSASLSFHSYASMPKSMLKFNVKEHGYLILFLCVQTFIILWLAWILFSFPFPTLLSM